MQENHYLMNKNSVIAAAINLTLTISSAMVFAQQLPAPSRTVFKCTVNGATVYSDAPCKGAERIDVEPTRGANSYSGRQLTGKDVRHEQNREAFAEAIRPITGMNAKQFDTFGRRTRLRPEAQHECKRLDNNIPSLEREEATATAKMHSSIQARLLYLRQQFRELGC